MVPHKHSAAGIGPGTSRDKSRVPEKFQPGQRTAAQIRFENEQSHERIRQIDKMGSHHPAQQGESTNIRPNPGNVNR